jgi:hypothetical protein
MVGSFLPFLAMNRPQQEAIPPVMPLPANNQSLDANLIAQLEAAQLGQSLASQQAPVMDLSATQPTQQKISAISTGVGAAPEEEPSLDMSAPLTAEQQLALASQEAINMQKGALEDARSRLESAQKAPPQFDLSPLLALGSQWTGKNLMAGYTKPGDKSKEIQALQEAVLKSQGNLSEVQRQTYRDVATIEQKKREMEQERILTEKKIDADLATRGKTTTKQEQANLRKDQDAYVKQYGDKFKSLSAFADKVSQLRSFLKEKNRIPTELAGKDRSKYETLVNKIIVSYNKDIAELGALAGADLKLLQAATGQDISEITGRIKAALNGPQASIDALESLLSDTDKMFSMKEGELRQRVIYDNSSGLLEEDRRSFEKSRFGGEAQAQQEEYTAESLAKIRQEDPERFKKILSEARAK